MTSVTQRERTKRRYRPGLEALEALKLLDHGLSALMSPGLVESFPVEPDATEPTAPGATVEAWDEALGQSAISEWLGEAELGPASGVTLAPDPAAVQSGLEQLERYLGRAWARAGIAPQQFEDCTQSVYATLLENLGRPGFEHLAGGIGRRGVQVVLNRDTDAGPDFFRAVDMVKKRTQREKVFVSLDDQASDLPSGGFERASRVEQDWRTTLEDTIRATLSPREAELIRETMRGKKPVEIAESWGVAAKTVSNEKTRVFHKLREALSELVEAN